MSSDRWMQDLQFCLQVKGCTESKNKVQAAESQQCDQKSVSNQCFEPSLQKMPFSSHKQQGAMHVYLYVPGLALPSVCFPEQNQV